MENKLTVYTKWGYGQVDIERYQEELQASSSAGTSPDKSDKGGDPLPPPEGNAADPNAPSKSNPSSSQMSQQVNGSGNKQLLDKMMEVQYRWGQGYIQRRDIKSKIRVFVKTFHGKRLNQEFTVLITDKIDKIRELLAQKEPEEMQSYNQIRLVYAMGTLRNLNLDNTFEVEEIPSDAQLVLLGQKTFTWDLNYKGSNIQLLNNCLTANKKIDMDYQSVLATVGFNSGKHYWEIKLDLFVDMEDIFVGVARRNIDLYMRAWDTGSFWGWICTGGRKCCPAQPGPQVQEYGGFSKMNEAIGVMIEFKNEIGTLSFFRNGQPLGVAFDNIPPGTYYPAVCLYYGEVQVTLNPKAKIPTGSAQKVD